MADTDALDAAVDLGQEYLQDDQIDQQVQGLVDDEGPPGQVEVAAAGEEGGVEDAELEAIKARVREMEEEAEKLKEMQNEVEKQMSLTSPTTAGPPTLEDKVETDNRSVYVGNVDYSATAEELEQHFHGCGAINRVTILCDKFSGHPKGFAYVEFTDKESVNLSLSLDDSLFKGRQIKVNIKRTNRPGISTTDRPSRSRGRGRGRSSYYGGGGGSQQFYSGYTPRRSRYRPRRFRHYSPY